MERAGTRPQICKTIYQVIITCSTQLMMFLLIGKNFIRRNLVDCKVYSDSNFIPFKRNINM